jgi:PAS domain S-box-containing protein
MGYAYGWEFWPIVISIGFLSALVSYTWRRRSTPGALSFTYYCVFVLLSQLGYGLALASKDPSIKLLWTKFNFLWQLPMAVAGLCFALEYANLGRFVHRRTVALLSIPFMLQFALTFTNYFHSWAWELGIGIIENFHERTPIGQFLYLYGVSITFLVPVIFVWLFFRSPLHRWPAGLCALGQLLTLAILAVGNRRMSGTPIGPFLFLGYVPVTAMYALALFRFRLLELIPIARKTIFEQMRDGMLILDRRERIVELNPVVEKILGMDAGSVRGKLAPQLPPIDSIAAGWTGVVTPRESEIHLDAEGVGRDYVLHLSPLKSDTGYYLGQVVLFHDITTQKQAQEQLLEQQRALATLQERVRIARELHDGLAQVLGYMKIQAQAARNWLDRGNPEEVDQALKRLVSAAQESQSDVRDYISNAQAGMSPSLGLEDSLREYLAHYTATYQLRTELVASPEWSGQQLGPSASAQVLRIVQEALTNARKHAQATGVRIILFHENGRAHITVADDGRGFNPAQSPLDAVHHFGLRFMRERAEEIGGRLEVCSEPGMGTRITVDVPLEQEAQA